MNLRPLSTMMLLILSFARMRKSWNAMIQDEQSLHLSKVSPVPLLEWSLLNYGVIPRDQSDALWDRNNGDICPIEISKIHAHATKYTYQNKPWLH